MWNFSETLFFFKFIDLTTGLRDAIVHMCPSIVLSLLIWRSAMWFLAHTYVLGMYKERTCDLWVTG